LLLFHILCQVIGVTTIVAMISCVLDIELLQFIMAYVATYLHCAVLHRHFVHATTAVMHCHCVSDTVYRVAQKLCQWQLLVRLCQIFYKWCATTRVRYGGIL